ncbi:MAG: hypothetical protein R3E09_05250 [Novosphingobium sp.]|nr:hypothetical protein [Novosphingobium sp.]MCB2078381.1 hypothetical protein [Novosphingobium sp.]
MTAATESGLALPRYSADPVPPVKLPAGRTIGPVTGMQVSPDGHIWVLHIANHPEYAPLGPDEPPSARMPSVMEFDADGNFLQGWGGPDWLPREAGHQQWPKQEETISFDDAGTIWVFGADVSYDHAVQRFTRDGKLLLRIGRFGETGGDESPDLLGCPTDCWHDVKRSEVYITDGYVNHRIAKFDSDNGRFLRSWGAYGRPLPSASADYADSFSNPVHAITLGPDGYLYVCDRKYDRVQVFDAVGHASPRFIREIGLDVESPFGSTFNLVFTPDGKFMILNDGNNSRLWIVDMVAWKVVDHFMAPNSEGADLTATVHKITADHEGNLLLGRTARGIERMRYEAAGA